jgi:pyruvate/2-oxoacid:ferredoxin oxidoreductase beta subunit
MKFKKARGKKGFRFVHILSPCPTGWGFSEDKTVVMARMAVESGAYRLMEWEGGEWMTTHQPSFGVRVETYLKSQDRFSHLDGNQLALVSGKVAQYWRELEYFAGSHSGF